MKLGQVKIKSLILTIAIIQYRAKDTVFLNPIFFVDIYIYINSALYLYKFCTSLHVPTVRPLHSTVCGEQLGNNCFFIYLCMAHRGL